MKRFVALVGIWMAGCTRAVEPPPPPSTFVMPTRASLPTPDPGKLVEPGRWRDPETGLGIEVPDGWTGRTGPTGATLRLTLEQERSGVQLEVWAFERSGPPTPRPRPGCQRVYRDPAGRHGGVPVLGPVTVATCLPEDPSGLLVQGWYGAVGRHEVHLEAGFPPGTAYSARADLEAVVRTLSWRP